MDDAQSAYDAEKLAYDHAKAEQAEWARRLSRYDEAVRHIENLALGGLDIIDPRMSYCNLQVSPEDVAAAKAFLADEPKP